MDRFPKAGDLVSFNRDHEIYNFLESSQFTIKKGTVLEILNISIHNTNAPDFAEYTLYLGIKVHDQWKVLKLNPANFSEIITIFPNTPAAHVLYGAKSEA